jgi:hypothetical protein
MEVAENYLSQLNQFGSKKMNFGQKFLGTRSYGVDHGK